MNKVKKTSIVLIIIVIIAIIIINVFNPKKALTFVLPDLSHIAYIDAKVKGDSLFTKIDLLVQNRSFYNIEIDSIYYKIKFSDVLVAKGLIALDITQNKFEIDTVKLPINVPFKKIRKKIKSIQESDSTTVDYEFYIIYNTIFGKMKIDYANSQRVEVPIPPEIKVLSSSKKKYNIRHKTLTANVKVELINNGKNIDMELSNIRYHFTSKKFWHKEQVLDQKIRIKPSATTSVKLPIAVIVKHPLKTAFSIIRNKDIVDYNLTIQADMKLSKVKNNDQLIPIHFEISGDLELKK